MFPLIKGACYFLNTIASDRQIVGALSVTYSTWKLGITFTKEFLLMYGLHNLCNCHL